MSGNFAAHPSIPADRDILVCIFQRGAADGLNALAPYSDADYYLHRPTIAIPDCSDCMIKAPRIAPPLKGELGSTAITATRSPASRLR